MTNNNLLMTKKDDTNFKYNLISATHTGLIPGYFVRSIVETNLPKINIFIATIYNYSYFIFKEQRNKFLYAAGYSPDATVALTKMCGEAVERYSSLMAHTLLDKTEYRFCSYQDLEQENEKVLPLKYIQVFSTTMLAKANHHFPEFASQSFAKTTKITWVKIYSVFDETKIWIPCQFFFLGFPTNIYQEKRYITTVSTGTAAHIDSTRALKNALIEALQINAFVKHWYFNAIKCWEIKIDDEKINNELATILQGVTDLTLKFYWYQDKESDLFIITCYIFNKNGDFPAITVGIQGAEQKSAALIGAALEAFAIYYSSCANFEKNLNQRFNINDTNDTTTNNEFFGDFSKNVSFYANKIIFNQNKTVILSKSAGIIAYSQLKEHFYKNEAAFNKKILLKLKQKKRSLFIMDITAPEVKEFYRVIKVFIPQFLPLFLPSLPFDNHYQFRKLKINYYIHPLG